MTLPSPIKQTTLPLTPNHHPQLDAGRRIDTDTFAFWFSQARKQPDRAATDLLNADPSTTVFGELKRFSNWM